ncbi:hypothetical protein ACUSIJ_19585 [Pseudochelatococcus sp. B33]
MKASITSAARSADNNRPVSVLSGGSDHIVGFQTRFAGSRATGALADAA